MLLNDKVFRRFEQSAAQQTISEIHLGLGYSAVTLASGGCGLCYTPKEKGGSCTVFKESVEFEGSPATLLLERIHDDKPLVRCLAIALANALNHTYALGLPDDEGDIAGDLKLKRGSKVAMIGYFAPIIGELEKQGMEVRPYDIGKAVGDEESFYAWAACEADALILTATSLITNSTERIFEMLGTTELPSILMGPSTIACPGLYEHLGIHYCAATVATDVGGILKDIRNGRGTPYLHKHSRKVRLKLL
ncbi:MAG: DUF364 domain-containing protein [Sphaerochaeta sp.]|nr:DUF364 domain-containing protein [Sphaerochaeta sp.]